MNLLKENVGAYFCDPGQKFLNRAQALKQKKKNYKLVLFQIKTITHQDTFEDIKKAKSRIGENICNTYICNKRLYCI